MWDFFCNFARHLCAQARLMTMRIKCVKIQNFRGIENHTFEFLGFNVLIGDNGTSKTTILEAINYCLSPSFVSSRVKYTDFHKGGNAPIEIMVLFDEECEVGLMDGYNPQVVKCKGVYLNIKKRDSLKGINKAFVDGFVIKHFLIPVAERPDRSKLEWFIYRANNTKFKFTDRHLTEALSQLPYRTYYYDKNRERQLQRGFNSSITSVYDDFNWRFVKNTRCGDDVHPIYAAIDNVEKTVVGSVDEKAIEKTLTELNHKLNLIIGDEVGVSLIDRFEPFNNASIRKKVGEINLEMSQLGSGIDMIVSLMFLETLASLAKEHYTILIDEPEIHLHPSLQLKLVKYISDVSLDHQVIISTHSPFIFKNLKSSDTNLITLGGENVVCLFPWSPSWGEINYFTYKNPTIEFHNELYGYLQTIAINDDSECEKEIRFDQWLNGKGLSLSKQWIRIRKGSALPSYNCTLQTYIRNTIHHPENNLNGSYTEAEFEESIKGMLGLLITP